jgi:nitrogen-specific signal transduction histidine kinase
MTDSSKDSGATDARVAEAIQRAKVQLEHMIDLNPECMVLVDQDGQVLRANRAFLELLHEGQFQSVLGSPLANLFPSVERAFFTSLLANKTNHSWFEKNEKMAEGGERRLQFGVLSGGASSEALVVIVHDVTRDQEKSALLEKGFKVEAVQALMGALMHHLNQPLTVVMIRARMMLLAIEQGEVSQEELAKSLKDIEGNAVQMGELLKRVEDSRDFETQEYVKGLDILKVDDGR